MSSFSKHPYGTLSDGTDIHQFELINDQGMVLKVIEFGGIITHLFAPDRDGNLEDVVLGFDTLGEYLDSGFYFGALIGRYGNRIANARFTLDGKEFNLPANDGPNNLHGGPEGLDRQVWKGEQAPSEDGVALSLTCVSEHGEMGFPGTVGVEVIYNLTNDNALEILYRAESDQKTVLNLTQHSYFNLAGKEIDVLDHYLEINADEFLPVDQHSIPLEDGAESVEESPFDFRMPKRIGAAIEDEHEQLNLARGYDHTFVIKPGEDESELPFVASAYDDESGRVMKVYSSEPGVQFYSGNFIDDGVTGKSGVIYNKRSGFCLETQHYPDSPNRPDFPSVVYDAGEEFRSVTVYAFDVIEKN